MKEKDKMIQETKEKETVAGEELTEEDASGYALCSTHKQTACQFDCIGGNAALSTSH